jgi:hypothetical protein
MCRKLQDQLTQSLILAIVGGHLAGTTKTIVDCVCDDLLPDPSHFYRFGK